MGEAHCCQVRRKTRIQLSKAIFRTASSSKPRSRSAAIRFCKPLASLIAVGIVAPSKSEPRATPIYPYPVGSVADVPGEHVQRGVGVKIGVRAHVVDGKVHTDESIGFANGVEFAAGRSSFGSRHRSHMRTNALRQAAPRSVVRRPRKSLLGEMGHVDHDPQPVTFPDESFASFSEPGPRIRGSGPRKRNPVAKNVRPAPDRSKRTQARPMKML